MTPLGEAGGVCVITLCLPSSWWRSRPRRCSWGASGSSPKLISRVAMALAKCLAVECSGLADPRDEGVFEPDGSVLVDEARMGSELGAWRSKYLAALATVPSGASQLVGYGAGAVWLLGSPIRRRWFCHFSLGFFLGSPSGQAARSCSGCSLLFFECCYHPYLQLQGDKKPCLLATWSQNIQ